MAVAAMGGGNTVLVLQMHHNAGAGSFFTRIEMHEARNIAFGEFRVEALLELANGAHRPIGLQKPRLAKWK